MRLSAACGVQGKMAPWTRYVRECLNSAGQTLESEDLNSLGALILNVLNDQKATRKPPSASGLVAELVRAALCACGTLSARQTKLYRVISVGVDAISETKETLPR